MNPLLTLELELKLTQSQIIHGLSTKNDFRFANHCVENAKDDSDLTKVRELAKKAYQWWNP